MTIGGRHQKLISIAHPLHHIRSAVINSAIKLISSRLLPPAARPFVSRERTALPGGIDITRLMQKSECTGSALCPPSI
jgi:hypothetical protein